MAGLSADQHCPGVVFTQLLLPDEPRIQREKERSLDDADEEYIRIAMAQRDRQGVLEVYGGMEVADVVLLYAAEQSKVAEKLHHDFKYHDDGTLFDEQWRRKTTEAVCAILRGLGLLHNPEGAASASGASSPINAGSADASGA